MTRQPARFPLECRTVAHAAGGRATRTPPAGGDYIQSEFSLRAKALVSVLTRKNLVAPNALDDVIEYFEIKVGPHNGAKVVARSWVDPEYHKLLLENATSAVAQFNLTGIQGTDIVAVANTPKIHNLVVCTLCSCYPWPLLGLPPTWYKDTAYRSRAVIDPRGLLREFGLELGDDVEVRVWDSTTELRYLVNDHHRREHQLHHHA